MRPAWRPLFAISATTAFVAAQTNTPEIEPNETKALANPTVACMVPGDTITGNTTGTSTTVAGPASADTYLVTVCAEPNRIYQNRLALTTAGPVGHVGTIRGLSQTAGVPNPGTDSTFQTSSTATTPARMNQWIGFGKGESLYYRVTGVAATTADYVSTLSSSEIRPPTVPGSFLAGTIVIQTVGQTAVDTEMYLYDANFNPVPLGHNDDEGPGGATLQSRITIALASGTYYLGIGRFSLGNNQGDANPTEDFLTGVLLDFPDMVVGSSTTTPSDFDFTITDSSAIPVPVANSAHVGPYAVAWTAFNVGLGSEFRAFCAGDHVDPNVTTDCPCANAGQVGHGCANSVNAAGARLDATGSAALDNVVLAASGMPAVVSAIYLQGDAVGDIIFGDGVRCTDGTLIRLRTRASVGGASTFPDSTDTITLSARGGVVPGSGARRYYQTYYRNSAAGFCPPETFNVTNGWVIDW